MRGLMQGRGLATSPLSPEKVERIRKAAKQMEGRVGLTALLIERFGCSRPTIRSILAGTYGQGKRGGRGR